MKTIKSYWIFIVWFIISTGVTLVAQEPRPNIVFFIADDMTRDMFNFLPESKGKNLTPALDRLSDEGVILMGQHVSATVCTPSRYNCLTGNFASRANNKEMIIAAKKNDGQRIVQWNTHILPGEDNLASLLKEAGYYTGAVGKNHVFEVEGYKKVNLTDDWNDPVIQKRQIRNYQLTQEAYTQAGFDFADGLYYENPDFNGPRKLAVHNLDWTTDAALDFLERSREKEAPFFLYFATTLPHGPLEEDRSWNADRRITPKGMLEEPVQVLPGAATIPERLKKAGKPVNNQKNNLLWMDDALQALLNKLEENGQLDHTVIIFFNDHGQYAKGTIYQGAVHNPSILWKKGGFPVGKQADVPVSNVDFVPTLLEMAGIESEDRSFDGKSFYPMLQGESLDPQLSMYFEIGYSRGVRKGKYKYIAVRYPVWVHELTLPDRQELLDEYNKKLKVRRKEPNNMDPSKPFGHVQIIPGGGDAEHPATERYPYYADADQLYDLECDPDEQNNLANDPEYREILEEMKKELTKYCQTIPGNFGEFRQ
jgi:arylsulfatase A-like enzyme